MGFLDAIKKISGYEEEDEDLDYNDNEDDDESVSADDDYGYKRTPNITSVPRSGKVLNIPATTRLQVIVFKAERFNDVVEIADHFKSNAVELYMSKISTGQLHYVSLPLFT